MHLPAPSGMLYELLTMHKPQVALEFEQAAV